MSSVAAAAAQTGSAVGQPPAPTVSVTSPVAAPGERTVVVLQVQGIGGRSVVQLRSDVRFPGELLRFVQARAAFQQAHATVKATLAAADSDLAEGTAEVSITATAAPNEPLAAGDVVELVFEVSRTVYTDRTAAVAVRAASLTTAGGDVLDGVILKDGEVRVSVASVVFGCFFYMH